VFRKAYYRMNGAYPEVVETKLIVYDSNLKCVLSCDDSKECNCFTGWDVTPLIDIIEVCNITYCIVTACVTGREERYGTLKS